MQLLPNLCYYYNALSSITSEHPLGSVNVLVQITNTLDCDGPYKFVKFMNYRINSMLIHANLQLTDPYIIACINCCGERQYLECSAMVHRNSRHICVYSAMDQIDFVILDARWISNSIEEHSVSVVFCCFL